MVARAAMLAYEGLARISSAHPAQAPEVLAMSSDPSNLCRLMVPIGSAYTPAWLARALP